jgi:hypothetical protein
VVQAISLLEHIKNITVNAGTATLCGNVVVNEALAVNAGLPLLLGQIH